MRIIETKAYQYSELSEEAQEKARESLRTSEFYPSNQWWDSTYEDAKTIAALMGIQIDDMRFSGFCKQGDGASYTGRYSYAKGSVKSVKEHAPQDVELHRIAQVLSDNQKLDFYSLTATITRSSSQYVHENTMSIDVEDSRSENRAPVHEEYLIEALKDFARWIYRQLEKEYDHLMSDEAIAEHITANEYEYTEDGEPI